MKKIMILMCLLSAQLHGAGEAYLASCYAILCSHDCRDLTDEEIEELDGGAYSDSRWVADNAEKCDIEDE